MTQIKHAINEEYKSEVFLMDCMEGMKKYEDNHFDLAVVDPPYGINMGMGHKGSEKRGDKNKFKTFAGGDTSIPKKDYFTELFRVSKNQIIWGANYMTEYLYPTGCFIIWDKQQPEDFSMAMCEYAWTSFTSPAKIFQKRIVGADNVRIHPTQKPTYLYDWVFKKYASEGQKILDTHLGSQSSRISANKNKLHFTGFELDPDYFRDGNRRYEDHVSQLTLF